MTDTELRRRFQELWSRLGASREAGPLLETVLQAYQEPHRVYHGVDHLRDCLAQLDGAPARGAERDLAEAALWFHDIVYVPGAADNESRSADRASAALLAGGVVPAAAREIARLVRLTDHTMAALDPVGALVCDVDLSILGRTPAEFAEYERRIRAEYRHVPDFRYRLGRRRVLTGLLDRQPLYRSAHFRDRYEAQARRNLAHALEMAGPGDGERDPDHVERPG